MVDNPKQWYELPLPADYDWDGDGVPDRQDTLPTVAGTCSNRWARGVKDSDRDGLCDPGRLDYHPRQVAKEYQFGELGRVLEHLEDFDNCPYLPGTAANKGCPDLDQDGLSWYEDPDPFAAAAQPATRP